MSHISWRTYSYIILGDSVSEIGDDHGSHVVSPFGRTEKEELTNSGTRRGIYAGTYTAFCALN